MLRTIAFASLLFAMTIAFSGVAFDGTLTEDAAAQCIQVQVDGVPECLPHPTCVVAFVYTTVTGEDAHCTM